MSKLTDFPVYSAKTKKRVKYGILGSSLIVVLVMAALLTRPPVLDPLQSKISVTMTAQVYRGGVLVDERVNDDDLLLVTFLNLTQALLHWPNDAQYDIELMTYGGTPRDFTIWNETSSATIADSGYDNYLDVDCIGRYGSDDTAPTRTDDSMGSQEETKILDSFTQASGTFTLTFIATASGAFDWKESGLSTVWWSSDLDDPATVLLCRDTFSTISVEASDTIVLNYRFNFGSGYTTNYITFLLYLLMGADDGETVTISLTDTGGNSRTVTIYSPLDEADWFGHFENVLYGGHLIVSDSSSGIPARGAYRLLGSSLQTQATVTVDESNWDVTLSAVFVPTSAITIVAAAYYRYTSHSAGDAYIMMFALSHSAVYVAASTPVQATFTMEM